MLIVAFCLLIARYTVSAPPSSPFSYVATPMFGAYQATFKLSSSLNSSSVSQLNPYTVNFKEARNGVTMANTFVSLGSFDNYFTNLTACSFRISVAAAISTQALLQLAILGSSQFESLSFFLIVVSSANLMYVDVAFFQNNATNLLTTGAQKTSAVMSYVTSVTGTFKFSAFLSYFTITQANPATDKFQVGIDDSLVPVGSNISFTYYVKQGTIIEQIGIVLLVYRSPSSNYPTDYSYTLFPTTKDKYGDNLNSATGDPADFRYKTGYEDKCIVGHTSLQFDANFSLTFNISNLYDATNSYTSSYSCNDPSFKVNLFCLIMQYNCSKIDNNCTACTSLTVCSECKSSYFPYVYANLTSKCQLCSLAIAGCDTCTNSTYCQTCITPTYLIEIATHTCAPCNKYTGMSNCLNCTSNTTCTGCMSLYGLKSGSCTLCSTMIIGCQECPNNSSCTKCLNGYYLNGTNCQPCTTAISNCAICSNSTYCVLCNSDSYLDPTNTSCICNQGLYAIAGLCSYAGCSSAYRFGSSSVCLSCNTSSSFYLSGSTCNCMIGYNANGSSCNLVCGDSRVITQECDDGNLINGDGCNSTCFRQSNYKCVNGSLNTTSVCVYNGSISVALSNIVKTQYSNQVTLSFTISPAALALNSMNFNNYTNLWVGGQKINCTSSNISCTSSYDQAGTLSLVINYNKNLQGLQAIMMLSYDSNKLDLQENNVSFKMVGTNLPILEVDISGQEKTVYIMGYAIAGLYVLVLLLSTVFHKMIGLQTMQILQNVFFVRYLLNNSSPYVFFNMNSIKYINGYNIFSQFSNFRYLDSSLLRMGIGKNFVFNVMEQVLIILIMWGLSLIFSRKIRNLKLTRAQMTSQGMQVLKRAQLLESKFTNAAFIFTVYSFYIVVFSTLSSVQSQDENLQLPRALLVFTLLILFYTILFIAGQIYTNWKSKIDEEQGLVFKYISVFLIYHVLMGLLLIALPEIFFGKIIIAACQLIYLIALIVIRPYFLGVQNLLLIISQFAGLGFTTWLILSDFIAMNNNMLMHQAMLGYEGLLLLVGIMAIVRLVLHFKDNEKAFKLMHQEEDRLKGKDSFSKIQFKKQQNMLNNPKVKHTISEKKRIEEVEEFQELQRIKNRLKGEHKIKLMEDTIL